ncbi:cytochrome c [Massilia terrae]|uniref:C-type cytochrome n=1 Tax=Massilia terrae TaxID=1811224 RepID=A0ABT2CUJ7_9BURK|nr:c-type cytochrome [Massilia terrae]
MRQARNRLGWACIAGIAALLAASASATLRPAVADAGAPAFTHEQVVRGARLAAIGTCASCHTADPARPFAGGVPLRTPFGTIYSTNITPDKETGIGGWPLDAFTRAMRDGVSRDGHHLYPAFPYNYYTHLSDADIADLYAFIMTRDPVRQAAHANEMRFPFGIRALVAGWNMLYLDKSPVMAQADKDAQWNRGAYLVQSLGHCGACHTPQNSLGAPDQRRYLGGGEAEGWFAPALNADSPSPLPWTVEQLTAYLRTGIAADHAIAGGPMQEVSTSFATADESDVRAIATYLHSTLVPRSQNVQDHAVAASQTPLPAHTAGTTADDRQLQLGAQVYADACARCHDERRQASSGGALQMPMAVAVYDPDPRSFLHIVRDGITPPSTEPSRWMPGFAGMLTDEQQVALAAYLRRYAAGLPPWPGLPGAVEKAKRP